YAKSARFPQPWSHDHDAHGYYYLADFTTALGGSARRKLITPRLCGVSCQSATVGEVSAPRPLAGSAVFGRHLLRVSGHANPDQRQTERGAQKIPNLQIGNQQ